MAQEHEARQPYKCAVCGAKFDSQDQLQNHLKSCTQKRISDKLEDASDDWPRDFPFSHQGQAFVCVEREQRWRGTGFDSTFAYTPYNRAPVG